MIPSVETDDIPESTSHSNKSWCRDVSGSTECIEVDKHNNRETLNMLIKEFLFCIALALTTYGALHSSQSKVSKYPQVINFFQSDSVVTDWYKGQLSDALSAVNQADVSFVMYYAPWDAECQYVRGHFERAAQVLGDWVNFSAINCWSPGSECRLLHNKISSWPILIAYTITSRGVLYKGPRDAHSMVKFLELIMKPLEKISSADDLVNLLSVCDAVAVGYTPLSDTAKFYNIWYNVALKIKELDTLGEICFGVVTSEELALHLGVDNLPSARLMTWNDTKEYSINEMTGYTWNESLLTQWILENFTQPIARIIPLWRKAFSFEKFVDGNPLLILFTPLNPIYNQLPAYDLLREVAMEYYSCINSTSHQWTMELLKLKHMQRLLYQQKDFMAFCKKYKYKKPVRKKIKMDVVCQNNKYIPWSNATQKSIRGEAAVSFMSSRSIDISKSYTCSDERLHNVSPVDLLECSKRVLSSSEKKTCEDFVYCESNNEHFSFEETMKKYEEDTETTMLPFEDDPLSSESLMPTYVKHFCKVMKFAEEWGKPVLPTNANHKNVYSIEGVACQNNYTLNMVAVDSVANHHFAESLGIDIKNKKDMTVVVILDTKHESQYVLSDEYSAKSLREFIYNFTNKRLKRSLRTDVAASHTHYFRSDNVTQWNDLDNSTHRVIELTTRTFRKTVRTHGTMTLLGVCNGACPATVSHALITAQRLLSGCGVRAQAARLDARRHDLPWHYTPHALPALLVLTADSSESGSRSYPSSQRVTPSGVVALALRALDSAQHIVVRLTLCKTSRDKRTCLKHLKHHVTSLIGRNLRYWRRTEVNETKVALLKRLQNLHRVSFDLHLIHLHDLRYNTHKLNSLVNSLRTLSTSWDVDMSILKTNNTS